MAEAVSERDKIIALIKREVVPTVGCTEPMAVALCVAKCCETLGCRPDEIDVRLSANILKNAMGVGIPGTGGMIGLPIAIALGAIAGRSAYELEVIKDATMKEVSEADAFVKAGHIHIALASDVEDKLYIEVHGKQAAHEAVTIIRGSHTHFVYTARDGEVLLDRRNESAADDDGEAVVLNFRKVYDFAMETPYEDIAFILEARDINIEAAHQAFKGNYGHRLGKLMCCDMERDIVGDSTFSHILSYTSAACDARMAGALIQVMSNSGSGNQGIATTVPVSVFAADRGKSEEELARALILSNLTAIYIKQSLGRLSALCGCVVAATGSACGITWLMGGNYTQTTYAVKNMIATLTGMICDGAKPGCALKLTSGVSTAVLSAMLAMQNICTTPLEGIIDRDVDLTIRNLTRIGSQAMNETDRMVLDIMSHKDA